MRRVASAVVILAALALGAAGLAATTNSAAPKQAGQGEATKLTVWVGWSARELGVFKSVVAEYDKKHPEVARDDIGACLSRSLGAYQLAGTPYAARPVELGGRVSRSRARRWSR